MRRVRLPTSFATSTNLPPKTPILHSNKHCCIQKPSSHESYLFKLQSEAATPSAQQMNFIHDESIHMFLESFTLQKTLETRCHKHFQRNAISLATTSHIFRPLATASAFVAALTAFAVNFGHCLFLYL